MIRHHIFIPGYLEEEFRDYLQSRPFKDLIRFKWYTARATAAGQTVLLLGMLEFGYLVLAEPDEDPEKAVIAAIVDLFPEDDLAYYAVFDPDSTKTTWGLALSIPEFLTRRMARACEEINDCDSISVAKCLIFVLNQKQLTTLDDRTLKPRQALLDFLHKHARGYQEYQENTPGWQRVMTRKKPWLDEEIFTVSYQKQLDLELRLGRHKMKEPGGRVLK